MSTEQLEVERKFDVATTFTLPDLSTVPGVAAVLGPEERALEAVYHDTPDLRLARARVTMRRRTGGPDEGWHVKLPTGNGARRELHSPLGKATKAPPRAVSAPVRGLVRTAPLGPVATLHTRRLVTSLCDEAGRVLAEVADDAVTATATGAAPGEPATVLSWREVEVELADGDMAGGEAFLDAVAERLVAAGAAPSSSASKLARVLAHRLAATDGLSPDGVAPARVKGRKSKKAAPTAGAVVLGAVAAQVRALQEADLLVRTEQPEGIHDLRVACRRLRSILAAFRPVLDREHTDPLRDELQWVGQEVSGARDGEVALGHLRTLVEAQPAELVLGPVAARLQQAAIKDAEAGRTAAARTLDDQRYLRLVDALFELLETPPLTAVAEEPARTVLVEAVRRSGRRFRRQVDAARDDPHGPAIHEVRKAAKRVRYTAEVAVPILGRRAKKLVKAAENVQEALGDRQDTVVTRELCRTVGLAAFAAGENAWTYGRLHALEEARAASAEAEFWDRREPRMARALVRATR